jgi:ATP-dependent exoDNAse (exonuclease V) alpha subunit
MCVANHRHEAWRVSGGKESGEVASGEIGMVVHWAGKKGGKPNALKVEFSTQPGLQFTFWDNQLDSEDRDLLELAYAVTIHKSQGSQFGVT